MNISELEDLLRHLFREELLIQEDRDRARALRDQIDAQDSACPKCQCDCHRLRLKHDVVMQELRLSDIRAVIDKVFDR